MPSTGVPERSFQGGSRVALFVVSFQAMWQPAITQTAGCPHGTWAQPSSGASSCTPFTSCPPGTHVIRWGNETTDRECAPCRSGFFAAHSNTLQCSLPRNCPAGMYVLHPPTASSDRVCDSCTTMINFSNRSNAADCTPIRTCSPGEFVSVLPIRSRDRGCTVCPQSSFSTSVNVHRCTSATTCPNGQFAVALATAMRDTQCAPISPPCHAGEIEARAPGLSADRLCLENMCLRRGAISYCHFDTPICRYSAYGNGTVDYHCEAVTRPPTAAPIPQTSKAGGSDDVSSTALILFAAIFLFCLCSCIFCFVRKMQRQQSLAEKTLIQMNGNAVFPYSLELSETELGMTLPPETLNVHVDPRDDGAYHSQQGIIHGGQYLSDASSDPTPVAPAAAPVEEGGRTLQKVTQMPRQTSPNNSSENRVSSTAPSSQASSTATQGSQKKSLRNTSDIEDDFTCEYVSAEGKICSRKPAKGSFYCSNHRCPKCNGPKSSRTPVCAKCTPASNVS